MAISTYLPIITLNVNGLNILNERHRASVSVDEETSPIDVLPTGDSLETLGQTEHEEMEKPGQRKWKPEESVRSYGRQNGLSNKGCHTAGHYVMTRSIQQENATFINIYAPNIGTPKHTK